MSQTSTPPPPPPPPAPDTGPRVSVDEMRDVSRLQRSAWDRKIAGVAGGLGRHLDIDPTVVRVVLVVLCFFGGAGFLLYAAAWLLVPDERTARGIVPSSGETRKWLLYAVLALVVVVTLGGSGGLGWTGFGWGPGVPLLGLLVLAVVLLVNRDKGRPTGGSTATAGAVGASPTGQEGPVALDAAPHPRAAWAPPPYTPPSARPSRRPRRTGLLLFWPTLALIAVGLGGLGIYDASHPVEPAAYGALALAVTGLMLVVGAFRGRPGGLVLLGVVSALALAVGSITGGFARASSQSYDPGTADQVRPAYSMDTGELVLNLSNLGDVEALAGRQIDLSGDTGEVVVIVPRDLRVDLDAEISGLGGIDVGRNDTSGGFHPTVSRTFSGTAGAPVLDLDIDLRVGHIDVRNDR